MSALAQPLVLYSPSEVQSEAHYCEAREICYGGTQGCGKTWWLRWDPIITQVYDWNGSKGEHTRYLEAQARGEKFESKGWALHLRRTYKDLEQTIQKVLGFIFKVDPGASYNSKTYTIKFTCGYRIQFGHCMNEDDWRQYDSNEYSHIAFDEAIQFTKSQFDGVRRRLRCEDQVLNAKRRLCLATNPDAPVDGVWVKERYYDPAPDGRKMLVTKVTMSDGTEEEYKRIFFPAFLSDNPDHEFRKQTEIDLRTQPQHIMEARLFGRWDIVDGGFFAHEWVPSVHVVKPFDIPSHWPKGRAMDWGYKKACPNMWFAKNEDDDLIIYREVTYNYNVTEAKRKDAQLVALAIKKVEQANGEWDDRRKCSKLTGPADYQICERRGGQGPTIEETMANEGVYWVKSTKNRCAATAELIRRLKDRPTRPGAHPAIMVFDTCENLKRIMPLIRIDKDDDEVPLKDDNGHWLETLMYICMYCLPKADKARRKDEDDDEADELKAARVKRQASARAYGGYGS
jgi:hypothetical protein